MAVNTSRATATGLVVDVSAFNRSQIYVEYVILTAGADAATAVFRVTDGSGEYIVKVACPANSTEQIELCKEINNDLHVTLTGTGPEVVAGWL